MESRSSDVLLAASVICRRDKHRQCTFQFYKELESEETEGPTLLFQKNDLFRITEKAQHLLLMPHYRHSSVDSNVISDTLL